MKKIESLNDVIKAFDLKPEEIVKNLYESGAVNADFLQKLSSGEEKTKPFADINFIPSK